MNKQEKLEQELRSVLNPIISDFASRMVIAQQKFINYCVDNNIVATTAQIESICGTYRRPAKRTINTLVKRITNELFQENNNVYLNSRSVGTVESINANLFRENAVDTPLEALSKGNEIDDYVDDLVFLTEEETEAQFTMVTIPEGYVFLDEDEADPVFLEKGLDPRLYTIAEKEKLCNEVACSECIFENTSAC